MAAPPPFAAGFARHSDNHSPYLYRYPRLERFDSQSTTAYGNYQVTHLRHHRPIDHQNVTIENSARTQRIPCYPHKEGSQRMIDKVTIQTQWRGLLVLCRGGKAVTVHIYIIRLF
jgi:hypothetical protein